MTNPIIIGIDPGYDRLGWAVAQKNPYTTTTKTHKP